jgi:hypothetical protein
MKPMYLTEPDEVAGLLDYRQDKLTYDQWVATDYVQDMWRRKAYYDERQVEVNTRSANVSASAEHGPGYASDIMSPDQWNMMHEGPGWEDICSMLPDATQESCVKFFGINLTPVIINNRQVVYSLPVKSRAVRVDGKEDEETSRRYRRLTKAANHDLLADQLCKWSGLFTTAFQMFAYDEKHKRVTRHNLEPWRVLAFESEGHSSDLQDPGVMVCVLLTSEDLTRKTAREDRPVWQVWWRDRYWFEREPARPFKDRECTVEGTNENPFRDKDGNPVKPILSVKDIVSDQIYERGSDMLIQQSQVIDRQLTSANYTVEYQGFAVPVVTGADPEEVEANPHSPGAAVVLRNPDSDYRYVNPNARPSEFLSAIRTAARTVARLYAVDPELVDPDSKVQSGVAKAQSRVSLIERRKREFPKWVVYEREAYWITAVIWNTFHAGGAELLEIDRFISGDPSRPEEEVVVEYAPLAPTIDELSDSMANKANLDMNLTTREEILATQKDIDIEAARKMAADFKKTNEKDRGLKLLTTPTAAGADNLRMGQMGNRPHNPEEVDGDKRPGVTAASGNLSLDRKVESEP